ncbi:hypothetical protein NL50_17165 [Clostridium acetobutylicum]|nr:hypothetical protein NL50_17165 [Clostridium acetobutylicum]
MIKSNITEIQELLKLLPLLIIYVAPGYVFFLLKRYMLSEKGRKDNYFILSCLVTSYITVRLVSLLFTGLRIQYDTYSLSFAIVTIFLSLISSYIFCRFINSKKGNNILNFLGMNKSVCSNIFEDVIDRHYGAWVRLYINEENIIYTGKLVCVEGYEENDHSYVVLCNYKSLSYKGMPIDDKYKDSKNWVIINIKKVNRIEIIHDSRSYKIKEVDKRKIRKNNKMNFFKKSIKRERYIPINK